MTWGLRTYAYNVFMGPWDDITDIVRGLRLSSAVHGGLQAIDFDIADDWVDAYRWAYDHIGCKVYVFDNAVNPPVAEGTIFEPGISHDGNHVTAAGPWQSLCFSRVYNDAATWYGGGTTYQQIMAMLAAAYCPGVNADQSNIDDTGTANWPWQPTENKYAGDYIPYLASLSDAANAEWYFWLRSAPMAGTTPAEPIPYFKAASSISQVYQCWRKDITNLNLAPSLRDLANDVRVLYRSAAGVQNQTTSAQDVDSIARFGTREAWAYDLGVADATGAAQYRDALLAKYKDPQQSASFTVNTWAYDQWAGKWPLWRVIADFPVKFCVNDLIPDSTVLGFTLDYKRTFITLAAEYDYDSNSLTITPDTESNRADAILARYRGLQ